MTTTEPEIASPPGRVTVTPNVYQLAGDGVRVTYYPSGEGPLTSDGAVQLVYHDSHLGRAFRGDQVTVTDVARLGSLVTAALHDVPDVGTTTVSLLIPAVDLGAAKSVVLHTLLITTLSSTTLIGPGQPQRAFYSVTKLHGTASTQVLPLAR